MNQTDQTSATLTEHFMLVIDNEQGDYNYRREMVREAMTSEYPKAALQDSLREWAEEMLYGPEEESYDALNIMQREIIGVALNSIDWYEMAVRYIAEEELS